MLHFAITIPASTAADVISGELKVKIGAAEQFTVNTVVGPAEIIDDRFAGADNDPVSLEFRYYDDANNVSEPSVLDIVLTDTLPPGQPGALGLRVTSED